MLVFIIADITFVPIYSLSDTTPMSPFCIGLGQSKRGGA